MCTDGPRFCIVLLVMFLLLLLFLHPTARGDTLARPRQRQLTPQTSLAPRHLTARQLAAAPATLLPRQNAASLARCVILGNFFVFVLPRMGYSMCDAVRSCAAIHCQLCTVSLFVLECYLGRLYFGQYKIDRSLWDAILVVNVVVSRGATWCSVVRAVFDGAKDKPCRVYG